MVIAIQGQWLYKSNGKILQDQTLIVEDDKISEIGPTGSVDIPRGAHIISFPKSIITPPFVNAHTHLPETLIRGICDDADLHTWLYDHVWQVEPKMREEDAKIGSLLGIAELLSSGSGAFIDQFYFSSAIADTVLQSGIKAFLAPSIFEGNAETGTIEKSFSQAKKTLKKYHLADDRIMVGLGPHAPYSVEDEMYMKCYDVANKYNSFIHTHLNETESEVKVSISSHGMTPIEKMEHLGVLDRTLAAHCVFLKPSEYSILAENGTIVLHNPTSNLKIGSGIADIPGLLDNRIKVLIGTDGSASNNNLDMLEELRLVLLLHKGFNRNPKLVDSITGFNMATSDANSVFGSIYSGLLEVGHSADICIWGLDHIETTPIISPLSNLVYSASKTSLKLNMINGKILLQEGKFYTLDIAEIIEKAQESTDRMIADADYIPNK